MKNAMIKIKIVIVILVTLGLFGCQKDVPTVQEKVEAMLVASEWNKPVVTVDGIDQSDLYQNFTIKFMKSTYSSSGGSPLWPISGTWIFKDKTATTLTLDSKMEVQINDITDATLELTVQNDNTTFTSGRTNSIKGKNIFKLKKK